MSVGDAGNDTARRAAGLETAVAAALARSDGIAEAGERVLGAIAEEVRVGGGRRQAVPPGELQEVVLQR